MMKKKLEYPIAAKAAVVTAAALLIGGGTTASVLTAYADSAQEAVYEDEILDEDANENEDVDGTDAEKWKAYAATPSNATPSNVGIMTTAMRSVTSGTCGANLTWEYDDATKTLTISGSGAMEDYEEAGESPWMESGLFDQIEKVVIGDEVTTIGKFAFSGCTGLTEITFAGEVEEIGEYAFSYLTGLETLTFPKKVGKIGGSAFLVCEGLTEISFAGEVEEIDECAFSYLTGLETLTFQKKVGKIGRYAFVGCSGLKEISFADEVVEIDEYAFDSLTGLETLTFEKKVGTIGSDAFARCSGLKKISFADEVVEIGDYAFFSCSGLETLTFGKKVGTIGQSAFDSCVGLKKITFADEVGKIGNYAFSVCHGLETLTFEKKVGTIGHGAFAYCTSLYAVRMGEQVPEIGEEVFIYTNFVMENRKGIIVPNESYVEYCKKWSAYARYIAMADEPEEDGDEEYDLSASTGNAGTALGKKNLPSYVAVGTWTQMADGNWSFTSGSNGTGGSGGGAGALAKGWVAVYNPYAGNGQESYDWFYFDENGMMLTGWFTDPTDGNTYYLNPNSDGRRGAMLVGEQWIDRDGDGVAEQYYFNEVSDGTRGRLVR